MGSYNRDYMQDSYDTGGGGGPGFGHDVPATKWLLISTVIVFFVQFLFTYGDGDLPRSYVEEWFALDANKVLGGQVWRLVSYVFCHFRMDPFGLVFKMLLLWFFGSALERMYGWREILWFYLSAALICGLIFTAFGTKMKLDTPLMGSGPSVMALFTLYAMHFPRQEILFMWIIPVQIRVLLLIYVALDCFQILAAYKGIVPIARIAYLSELWGAGFAFLYRQFDWRLSDIGDFFSPQAAKRWLRRVTAPRRLKVYAPESVSNLDEQVDAILEKIHTHGSESLTDSERAILQRASEQAKHRL